MPLDAVNELHSFKLKLPSQPRQPEAVGSHGAFAARLERTSTGASLGRQSSKSLGLASQSSKKKLERGMSKASLKRQVTRGGKSQIFDVLGTVGASNIGRRAPGALQKVGHQASFLERQNTFHGHKLNKAVTKSLLLDLSKSAVGGNGGKNVMKSLLSVKNQNLWKKVRGAVKIAGAINVISKESESARRQRIKRHWDLVRQIARAAISLNVFSEKRDMADSKNGIKNYTRFCKILRSPPALRSDSDLRFLVTSTNQLNFFNSGKRRASTIANASGTASSVSSSAVINEAQHFELCRTMSLLRIKNSHEYVFRQGDVGEEFFIILDGSVGVQRKQGSSGVDRTVARLSAGTGFGELALSKPGNTRTASIVTIEPCEFLVIHKKDYERILRTTHQEAFEAKLKFLRKVSAFQDLKEGDLFNIAISLCVQKARVGETIVREGSELDHLRFFMIVKRGEMEIRKRVQIDSLVREIQESGLEKKKRKAKRRGSMTKSGDGNYETLSLCLMGPTESVCDHRVLCGNERENLKYIYPFSVVANTLVEYYCISKHDMYGKLSPHALRAIQDRVSRFPDEKTVKNAFAVSIGWKEYKAELVNSVIANRKNDDKSMEMRQAGARARKIEYALAMRSQREQELAQLNLSRQQDSTSSFKSSSKVASGKYSSSKNGANLVIRLPGSTKKHASMKLRPKPTQVTTEEEENRSTSPYPKGKLARTPTKSKRANVVTASKEEKARKHIEQKNAKEKYSQAAREIENFLSDGTSLTRHVYEHALSDGARFFARTIEWS